MVDIMRVPQRRENCVRKSEHQDVLRRLFAEEMIDSIGLLFRKRIVDNAIELARRGEIGSERLFDDYANPASFARVVQAGGFQVLENRFKLVWSGCKIEQAIAAGAVVFVDFIEAFCQALVTSFVAELALVIKNRVRKRLPNFDAHSLAGKLARGFFKITPEFFITFLAARESDNGHRGRQVTIGREVIKCRDQLAMGEIARSAEDHNAARLRHGARGNSFPERIWFRLISSSVHEHPQITHIAADFKRNLLTRLGARSAGLDIRLILAGTPLFAVVWWACRQRAWKLSVMLSLRSSSRSWCWISKCRMTQISGH